MSGTVRVGIRPQAMFAWRRLAKALDGTTPPCAADPAAWTSDDPEERAYAARACRHCPALEACRVFAEANREPHGVWGAVDRTPAARAAQPKEQTA